MRVEDVKARARQASLALAPAADDGEEALRTDATRFFARIPEPPLYRRRDDPVRKAAAELVTDAEGLLARVYQLEGRERVQPWRVALELHVEALGLIVDGRVEAADEVWHRAVEAEREATASRRLWSRTDERPAPVFARESGQSRYDPRAEASVQVKLACPSCRKVGDYSFSPRHASHRFACAHCVQAFNAYFAEVRTVEVNPLSRGRRYTFRVEELTGLQTRVTVDDSGVAELQAARRDLLAFLYAPATVLRGVLNLNSSRVLWLSTAGPCFVATVAFGEGARELEVLRAFRDGVLVHSRPGRRFIGWYYRHGPRWADRLAARPAMRGVVRAALTGVVFALRPLVSPAADTAQPERSRGPDGPRPCGSQPGGPRAGGAQPGGTQRHAGRRGP